ncbi:MAG: SDR family NAD(P)-dependent oxidoreductase, partial [Flavobacteriaceae bacterium]
MRFKDQIAIVFGAGRGIGKAIASRLSKEGAKLIIVDILKDEVLQVQQEIVNEGGDVEAYNFDITDEKKVNGCIDKIANSHPKIDILINTVGIVGPSNCGIEDYDLKHFIDVLNINLVGA